MNRHRELPATKQTFPTRSALAAVAGTILVVCMLSVLVPLARGGPNPPAPPPPTAPSGSLAATTPVDPPASDPSPVPSTILQDGDFQIIVDPSITPDQAVVEGFLDGDPAREVGRLLDDDGAMDVVLDELIVSTRTDAELDQLLARWGATLVDTLPFDDGDEYRDHLVRIDPLSADPSRAATELAALEPHDGTMTAGSDRLVRLLAALAVESNEHGTIVALNQVSGTYGVADGVAEEADDRPNPFTWSYLRGGGVQDFAVAPAWQLLEAHGRLERTVSILINDGGFSSTFDFPDLDISLRSAKWGDKSRSKCSGGDACPYHGTDVTMTAVGQLDNQYGTVGPSGPVVGELALVAIYPEQYKRLRKLDEMVDTYRPDVVNMSYGRAVTSARSATENIMNRRYKRMYDRGALLVAAAGNDGYDIDQTKCVGNSCYERRLVLPCESKYVMCVAGIDRNTVSRDAQSNYGSEDGRTSVEIWGPFDVVTINDPNRTALDFTTKWTSGTSFSSPFVAGIAGLVKAADPTLSNDEIRELLKATSNSGVQNAWITGSQRRVDALAAVAAALGVELSAPTVEITGPTDGHEYSVSNWLQLHGTAVDHRGAALPITWVSSIDGELGNQVGVVSLGELSLGTHVLTATAVDSTGAAGSDSITFDVIRRPIEITLSSPADGSEFEEGDVVALAAGTTDPDNFYASLPDGDVGWEIRKGNTVVWSSGGHDSVVPNGALTPGTYEARFSATAYGNTTNESVGFVVVALPPGHTKPVPKIDSPTDGAEYHTSGGPVSVDLVGSATDAEDGALPGTRFRWVARAEGDEVVLCTGSAFHPPTELGTLVMHKDCSDVTVELGVSPAAPGDWTWQVFLEVRDYASDTGNAAAPIDIIVNVG